MAGRTIAGHAVVLPTSDVVEAITTLGGLDRISMLSLATIIDAQRLMTHDTIFETRSRF